MSAPRGFDTTVRAWALRAVGVTRRTLVLAAGEVQRSVVEGSSRTGAPGQPVDTGYLKASWVGSFPTATTWQLTTNVAYAGVIEDGLRTSYDRAGVRPSKADALARGAPRGPKGGIVHVKSVVGGPHSVKLTRGGWKSIIAFAVLEARATESR